MYFCGFVCISLLTLSMSVAVYGNAFDGPIFKFQ
jgi:hypothetical protein